MSVLCSGCKKTKDNEDFGMKQNGSQYKTCVMCRDYGKKRTKLQNKQAEAALRGLQYCEECDKAQNRYEFIMPNGKSHNKCRRCLRCDEDINTMSVLCSGCKKTKDNEDFGIKEDGSQYKTCVTCRSKDKKRVEQEKNKASENNGELRYCNKCKTTKPMDKFVMPNGKSYNKCRRCLRGYIYDSDEDDRSPVIKADEDDSSPVIKADDEIHDYVVGLMSTLTPRQLYDLTQMHKSKHIFAYAEKALNRKELTYRKLSWLQVLPLINEVNKEIKNQSRDDDTSDESDSGSNYSHQCVYDPSDYEVGFSNI